MYGSHFIFLLFHNEVPISKNICEKTMAFHIDFHNLSEIHNLEIFLKYKRTVEDDKFIANDDNESIVVPYNSEDELDKSIVYQKKYDWKKYIIDDIGGIFAQILFIYQKESKKYSHYDNQKEEFCYEIEEIDKMSRNDSIILFYKNIHMKEL